MPPRRGAGDLVVGYIGRLSPVKGIEAAIRTVAAYQRTTPRPVRMLLAGEGVPEYVATLREFATAQAVRIELAGRMDVDAFCARVDVVVIPSTWMEPFGRVAVEIGLRRRPMLISPVGGLPEAAAISGGPHAFADFQKPDQAVFALADLLAGRVEPVAGPPAGIRDLPHVVSDIVAGVLGRRRAAPPKVGAR
jgi:glycosyltransferase involved in cell wall biosynthesis